MGLRWPTMNCDGISVWAAQRTKRTIEQMFTFIKAHEEVSAQKGAKAAIVSPFQLPNISS